MKKLLGHILAIVFMFYAYSIANAQDAPLKSMDASLDRYETLCQMCLDLRTRIKQGESVQKSEAEEFIGRFLALNKELKAQENDMSVEQRRRFAAIGQWFSTGDKPKVVACYEFIPIEGGLGQSHLQHTVQSKLNVPVLKDRRNDPHNLSVLAVVVAPNLSYGFFAGYRWSRWGGYASFRSNYVFGSTSYSCLSGGFLPNGNRFWSSGVDRKSNLIVSVGGMYRVSKWISAYVGAGYGHRILAWMDIDDEWSEVSDWSHRGSAFDIGVMFSWNRLVGSLGVTTIAFKTCSINVGLGYNFEL